MSEKTESLSHLPSHLYMVHLITKALHPAYLSELHKNATTWELSSSLLTVVSLILSAIKVMLLSRVPLTLTQVFTSPTHST